MPIEYYLNIFSTISGILPVIAALYNYRYLDKVLKVAAFFLLISVLFDFGFEIAKHYHVTNNFPAIHIFIVISLVFFSAIYYSAFFSPLLKKATLILSLLGLIILIFNTAFNEGLWDYPSISNTVLSVLLICFSLVYFYQLLNRQEFIHIEKQGLFWINAGVLFYYSVNIFLFMLFKQLLNTHEEVYMINNITNIIANVLFTVGLLCKPQLIQKTT